METNAVERGSRNQEQHADASKETTVGTSNSNVSTVARAENKTGYDQLPKELHEMKIKDDKGKNNNEKVFIVTHFFFFFFKCNQLLSLVIDLLCAGYGANCCERKWNRNGSNNYNCYRWSRWTTKAGIALMSSLIASLLLYSYILFLH